MKKQIKIIHLDDDPFELNIVENALEGNRDGVSFELLSVENAEEYLRNIKNFQPDIALLDVHIESDITGPELIENTRQSVPHAIVLMRSNDTDADTIRFSIKNGADDFLSKSSTRGELRLRIINSFELATLKKGKSSKPIKIPKEIAIGSTMQQIANRIPRILDSAISSIYIEGESGSGKEVVADLFKYFADQSVPFVKVNCGAIAPNLLESELFGHEKGAFTGADKIKKGIFESANNGWVFLDEIATLTPSAQIALLRVLENHEIRRVGGTSVLPINIRIIAATNEPLAMLVNKEKFRRDLFQRLKEAEIKIPPLRDRISEIPEIADSICATMNGGPYTISIPVLSLLKSHDWKEGNVRELRNCLRAMTELNVDKVLTPLSVPDWLWKVAETTQTEHSTEETTDLHVLKIQWKSNELPPFDQMTDMLLLELIKNIAKNSQKKSLRSLSTIIGMSRSTLSGRLKGLIEKGITDFSELSKYVGITEK